MDRIVAGFTLAFASSFLRYLLFAGVAYAVFYVVCRRVLLHRKIQRRFPNSSDYLREITFSFMTCVTFGIVGAIIFSPFVRPYTMIYSKIEQRGWLYFIGSIPAMVFVHDAYFYWSHRFLHWKPVFRLVHSLHHRSNNPSPWAALSFHPLEAIVQAGLFIFLAFLIPVHPMALLVFFAWTTFSNVVGHLGFEIFPRRLTESRWGVG
jgi:Delta7-sterol 5-desaturase